MFGGSNKLFGGPDGLGIDEANRVRQAFREVSSKGLYRSRRFTLLYFHCYLW